MMIETLLPVYTAISIGIAALIIEVLADDE